MSHRHEQYPLLPCPGSIPALGGPIPGVGRFDTGRYLVFPVKRIAVAFPAFLACLSSRFQHNQVLACSASVRLAPMPILSFFFVFSFHRMRNICCLTLLRRSCLHTVVLLCGGNGSTINSRNLRSDPRNRLPKDQLGTAANGISALVAKHTSGSVRIATNFSRKLKAAHLRIVRCAHSSEVKKTACRFQLVAPIPADTYFASRFDPTTGAGRSIPLDTYRPLNPGLLISQCSLPIPPISYV